jgi:hypothetical protein
MSYVAFAGVIALAFLPARDGVQVRVPDKAAKLPAVAHNAVAAPEIHAAASQKAAVPPLPAAPAASSSPVTAPAAPGADAPAADAAKSSVPPPEVWTPEELTAGLRSCLALLAPAGADIALEEPMKRGQCGTPVPLLLRSVGVAEKVEFTPAPTMNCRLAASVAEWVDKVLQPAAQQALGSRIKRIVGSSSYSCRNIYNNPKLTLSEHATGNAIDIAGFVTADGRMISVAKGWGPTGRDIETAKKKAAQAAGKSKDGAAEKDLPSAAATPSIEQAGKKSAAKDKGQVVKTTFKKDDAKAPAPAVGAGAVAPATTKEAAFLKRLHGGSCTMFATVLGPEANEAHRDHFHLDMKVRSSGATVCH